MLQLTHNAPHDTPPISLAGLQIGQSLQLQRLRALCLPSSCGPPPSGLQCKMGVRLVSNATILSPLFFHSHTHTPTHPHTSGLQCKMGMRLISNATLLSPLFFHSHTPTHPHTHTLQGCSARWVWGLSEMPQYCPPYFSRLPAIYWGTVCNGSEANLKCLEHVMLICQTVNDVRPHHMALDTYCIELCCMQHLHTQ